MRKSVSKFDFEDLKLVPQTARAQGAQKRLKSFVLSSKNFQQTLSNILLHFCLIYFKVSLFAHAPIILQ